MSHSHGPEIIHAHGRALIDTFDTPLPGPAPACLRGTAAPRGPPRACPTGVVSGPFVLEGPTGRDGTGRAGQVQPGQRPGSAAPRPTRPPRPPRLTQEVILHKTFYYIGGAAGGRAAGRGAESPRSPSLDAARPPRPAGPPRQAAVTAASLSGTAAATSAQVVTGSPWIRTQPAGQVKSIWNILDTAAGPAPEPGQPAWPDRAAVPPVPLGRLTFEILAETRESPSARLAATLGAHKKK